MTSDPRSQRAPDRDPWPGQAARSVLGAVLVVVAVVLTLLGLAVVGVLVYGVAAMNKYGSNK